MSIKNYYISSGIGNDEFDLVSFDNALISAGISDYNLLKVSSILPAGCEKENSVKVQKGDPLYTAYGTITSSNIGDTISSAICVGIPKNRKDVGVIMEFSGICSAEIARKKVLEMTKKAMENHNIECSDYELSSIETVVMKGKTATVISAVAMW